MPYKKGNKVRIKENAPEIMSQENFESGKYPCTFIDSMQGLEGTEGIIIHVEYDVSTGIDIVEVSEDGEGIGWYYPVDAIEKVVD